MNILLVEDNPADAYLLMEFLGSGKAPKITHVADGRDAINFVAKRGAFEGASRPDLIVLDLGLPRISGYDALKEFKQNPSYSAIPVVVLTTSCNPLDQRQCLDLGADAYFSKPRNLKGYEALATQLTENEFPRLFASNDDIKPPAAYKA